MLSEALSDALTGIERFLTDPANDSVSKADLRQRLILLHEDVRAVLRLFAKRRDHELVTR
jgi:hypothetical protein